jgi:hypothetical protein
MLKKPNSIEKKKIIKENKYILLYFTLFFEKKVSIKDILVFLIFNNLLNTENIYFQTWKNTIINHGGENALPKT